MRKSSGKLIQLCSFLIDFELEMIQTVVARRKWTFDDNYINLVCLDFHFFVAINRFRALTKVQV